MLIERNTIWSGTSSSGTTGITVNNYQSPPVVTIRSNTVYGGQGRWTRAISAWAVGAGSVIEDNDLYAGDCNSNNNSSSFALFISGQPTTVDSNRINVEPTKVGSCPNCNSNFFCGGIESEGSNATITNNIIYGMPSNRSVGLFYGDGEVPFGNIVIANNVIDGAGGAGSTSNNLSSALACRTSQGTNARVGRIRNNILFGGINAQRYGFFEDNQQNGRTCEPEFYENNNIFFYPRGGNSNGVAHRRWTGIGTQFLLQTYDDVNNNVPGAAGNFTADCLLGATFHILSDTSPCVDAGVAADAPKQDFEGDKRDPQSVDVGADER